MTALVSYSAVVQGLTARIEELCRTLIPLGRRDGPEWIDAHRAQGGLGDSLRVHLQPPRRGVWCHFADGGRPARGDALDLVAYILYRGDKRQAFVWARNWLGWDAAAPPAHELRAAAAADAAAQRRAAERDGALRRLALRTWLEAQESLAGTPAAAYLRGRGIDLAALGRQPRALRFHPRCPYFAWSAAAGRHVEQSRWPAIVAAVSGAGGGEGSFLACHRTYLQLRPDGTVGKAPLAGDVKKVLGRFKGGAIALWKGRLPNGVRGKALAALAAADGAAWTDPATGEVHERHANNWISFAEGVEDGLTVPVGDPARRVAAAVSVGNLANIDLPDAIRHVTVMLQADEGNGQVAAALARATARWHGEGRAVYVVPPPPGFDDINDLARGGDGPDGLPGGPPSDGGGAAPGEAEACEPTPGVSSQTLPPAAAMPPAVLSEEGIG